VVIDDSKVSFSLLKSSNVVNFPIVFEKIMKMAKNGVTFFIKPLFIVLVKLLKS